MRTLLAATVLLVSSSFAATEVTRPIFGTTISFRASALTDQKAIEKFVTELEGSRAAFDPDCMYPPKNGKCQPPRPTPLSLEAEKLAEELKKETDGFFDITRTIDGKKKRDFGGLIQGFAIDKIRAFTSAPVAINFSGDIFISPKFKNAPSLSVEDALVKGIKLASVSMGAGWMLGSSSPAAGSDIVNPKTGKVVEDADFHKVVLFAAPEFSGARLDAWSTALIAGGRPLLDKLSSLPEYKGKWGYFIVDRDEKSFCSTNITCELKLGIGQNYINVPW